MGNKSVTAETSSDIDDESLILCIDSLGLWFRYIDLPKVKARDEKIIAVINQYLDSFLGQFQLKRDSFSVIRDALIGKLSIPTERESLIKAIRHHVSEATTSITSIWIASLVSQNFSYDIDKELDAALAEEPKR